MARPTRPEHLCAVCNKPVDLKTTKTNDYGKVVHEECYVLRQALKDASQSTNQRSHPQNKTQNNHQ